MDNKFTILVLAILTLGTAKIIESIASKYNIFLFVSIYPLAGFITMSLLKKKGTNSKEIKKKSIKWALLIGIIHTIAVFSVLLALRIGDTSKTFPLNSLNIIPVMLFSLVFYNERVSWKGYLGIAFGIVAIFLLK